MSDVLSDEALDDLERKRQAATQGQWFSSTSHSHVPHCWVEHKESGETLLYAAEDNWGPTEQRRKDADYVAAANPEAIGRLIAEVRVLRRVPPGSLIVKGPASDTARETLAEGLKRLKASSEWGRVAFAPEPDEAEGLYAAAEFFEAMDASGDKEPLTPSAIACLLREYAADRRKRATGTVVGGRYFNPTALGPEEFPSVHLGQQCAYEGGCGEWLMPGFTLCPKHSRPRKLAPPPVPVPTGADSVRRHTLDDLWMGPTERQPRIRHAGGKAWATAKEFADGTRLLQREDGTFILPPESEWPTFFERISEDAEGTMGLKGGCWFLLKPRTEGEEKS